MTGATNALDQPCIYADARMRAPERLQLEYGEIVVFGCPSPARGGPNEDAIAIVLYGPNTVMLALADGAGGHPSGVHASQLALGALAECTARGLAVGANARDVVMESFEQANEAVTRTSNGAATTLAVAVLEGAQLQTFHTGDSAIVVVSQRGHVKGQTVSHSPVGYAETAGYLDEQQAMSHAERHLVSNMVGLPAMSVEVAAPRQLAPRDTLLLATDGLFDNLYLNEIAERIRCGPLVEGVQRLAADALDRMAAPQPGIPCKPDDLSIVAFRRRPNRKRGAR